MSLAASVTEALAAGDSYMKFFQTSEGRLHTNRIAGLLFVVSLVPRCRELLVVEPLCLMRIIFAAAGIDETVRLDRSASPSELTSSRSETTVFEQGLGLFGSRDNVALLDEVVQMAYEERRCLTLLS